LMVDGICGPITQAMLDSVDTGEATTEQETSTTKKVVILSPDDEVSILTGNGDSYSQIGIAHDGDDYEWVATSENGWYAVVLDNQVGWVSAGVCKIT